MIKLRLNKEIYSNENILKAVEAYESYAQMSIKEDVNHCILCFVDCKYDEVRTIKEFENYLIGLENS